MDGKKKKGRRKKEEGRVIIHTEADKERKRKKKKFCGSGGGENLLWRGKREKPLSNQVKALRLRGRLIGHWRHTAPLSAGGSKVRIFIWIHQICYSHSTPYVCSLSFTDFKHAFFPRLSGSEYGVIRISNTTHFSREKIFLLLQLSAVLLANQSR